MSKLECPQKEMGGQTDRKAENHKAPRAPNNLCERAIYKLQMHAGAIRKLLHGLFVCTRDTPVVYLPYRPTNHTIPTHWPIVFRYCYGIEQPRTTGPFSDQPKYTKYHMAVLLINSACQCRLLVAFAKKFGTRSGPEVIKLFSYSTQLSTKFILLINVKMPTIVDILTFNMK